MINFQTTQKFLINSLTILLLAFSFMPMTYAKLLPLPTGQKDLGNGITAYTYSGTETFTGKLIYTDCGLNTGCPQGYNFSITNPQELASKIPTMPLPETIRKDFRYPDSEFSFMLGDKAKYSSALNKKLQSLINSNVQLTLTNLEIGVYNTADVVKVSAIKLPKSITSSGPEINYIFLILATIFCSKISKIHKRNLFHQHRSSTPTTNRAPQSTIQNNY